MRLNSVGKWLDVMESHSHMHTVQNSLNELKLHVKQTNRQKANSQETVLLQSPGSHKTTPQHSICSHSCDLLHFQY